MAGCTTQSEPRPSLRTPAESAPSRATPTIAPTALPTAEESLQPPSPSATSTPELGPDVVAEVVTTDLVIRSGPGVAPESQIHRPALGPGDLLYLVDGPVSADGFEWYLADPYHALESGLGADTFGLGWVAAADTTGEEWIVPTQPSCPSEASLQSLSELWAPLRVACFADDTISLEGDVYCLDLGAPVPNPHPAWLTWDRCHMLPHGALPPSAGGSNAGVAIHYPPDAERLSGHLRITGHFDDPRAAECVFPIPTQPGDVYSLDLSNRSQQLSCRASLVIDDAAAL